MEIGHTLPVKHDPYQLASFSQGFMLPVHVKVKIAAAKKVRDYRLGVVKSLFIHHLPAALNGVTRFYYIARYVGLGTSV